mgnify:CR=1 FL=1
MTYPKSVDEIMQTQDVPAIGANERGLIVYINDKFTEAYGWEKADLVNKSITTIMPAKFRKAHQFGFSRFLQTEKANVAGQPLPLALLFKDGHEEDAEHFILAEKKDGHWHFAATITLRTTA